MQRKMTEGFKSRAANQVEENFVRREFIWIKTESQYLPQESRGLNNVFIDIAMQLAAAQLIPIVRRSIFPLQLHVDLTRRNRVSQLGSLRSTQLRGK
jgi:hypothetical protein